MGMQGLDIPDPLPLGCTQPRGGVVFRAVQTCAPELVTEPGEGSQSECPGHCSARTVHTTHMHTSLDTRPPLRAHTHVHMPSRIELTCALPQPQSPSSAVSLPSISHLRLCQSLPTAPLTRFLAPTSIQVASIRLPL